MKGTRGIASMLIFWLCFLLALAFFMMSIQLHDLSLVAGAWLQPMLDMIEVFLKVLITFLAVFCVVVVLHLDRIISKIKSSKKPSNDS